MKRTTQRLVAAVLTVTMISMQAFAVTPNQANINNLSFTGVDSSTGNATAPFIDHSTGSVYVTYPSGSGVVPTPASVGAVSVGNSTTTTLGANATFTGAWENVTPYVAIAIQGYSAQSSAANGVSLQFSNDGVNADNSGETYTSIGGSAFNITAHTEAQYFRLVWTNGASAQTNFRLSTVYKAASVMGELVNTAQPVTTSMDSTVVKDISSGLAGASAPVFAITVGGRDASGNLQQIKTSSYGGENSLVVDNVANGTNGASAPLQTDVIGGTDISGNVRNLMATASGVLYVNTEGQKATYRATMADFTPAASATDATTICGSATKTVKVTYVQASADATAPGSLDFYIYYRTAADTGGTSAVVAAVVLDQNDPAATATVRSYSANPTGLGAGNLILGDHYAMPAAASTGYPITQWMEIFDTRNSKAPTLRGVNQCLAFSFNGQTVPAGTSAYINWEWTEE